MISSRSSSRSLSQAAITTSSRWRRDRPTMFAMATLSLIPIFVIFLIKQKYLVEGIASTGIKG